MNADLERIKAALRLTLELDAKATPGPWEVGDYRPHVSSGYCAADSLRVANKQGLPRFKDGNCVLGGEGAWVDNGEFQPIYGKVEDFTFIAHARTFAPAAARALFEDIEWFESVANAGTGHTYEHSALLRLKNICRDWPEGAR